MPASDLLTEAQALRRDLDKALESLTMAEVEVKRLTELIRKASDALAGDL